MERNANYALVGLLTLVLAIGGFGFAYWLLRADFNQTYKVYEVVFDTPVNGLTKGAEVHFNGIKVGEVRALRLGKTNTRQVIATVRLDEATPVHQDSRARLEPQGVTGLAFIQITPGSANAPMLTRLSPGFDHPVIHSEEGTLDRILAGSGTVLEGAYESLNRINRLLSDQNIKTFSNSLDNLEAASANLKSQELLNETRQALRSATLAADSVSQLANSSNELIIYKTPDTLDRIDQAAVKLAAAADEVGKLSQDLSKPTAQLNDSTIPQMEEALNNLNKATRSLNALTEEARMSPQGLIAKPKPKDRKVEP